MKKAIAVLCLILCLASATGVNSLAVTREEIDALEAQRDELRSNIANLDEQIAAMEQSMETNLEIKAALDEQSELLRQETELLLSQIEIYEGLIAEKKSEAEAAEADKERHYEIYCSRVRAMEENSMWSYLYYVLHADSISELISRLTDISDIMSYDETLREEYISSCRRAEGALAEYERSLTVQIEKRNELALSQKKLSEKIEASAAIIAELEKDLESYLAFEERANEEMAEVQAEIDKKAEELRKQQEAEEAAKAPAYTLPDAGNVSSGYYMWPSATTYITSPFGPRVHPIYGQLKPHTGVDIGAWHGTEIYAAADGIVTAAVLDYGSTGYGTYVSIYHPNGTTTLYGHMSALAVSYGQNVAKGQVIGYVGSTGASNGPHIHFEIRQNGICVDPMQYFAFG